MALTAEQLKFAVLLEQRTQSVRARVLDAAQQILRTKAELDTFISDNQSDYDAVCGDGAVDPSVADADIDLERDAAELVLAAMFKSGLYAEDREAMAERMNVTLPGLPG